LAGATFGVSDTRELAYNFSRRVDATYFFDVAQFVLNLYISTVQNYPNSLVNISGGPIVVSSIHRLGLYSSEALHAPLLSAQALGFADTWAQACNATFGGEIIAIVGCDGGYDGLWLWLKPGSAAGVPDAHKYHLMFMSELILIAPTDGDVYLGIVNCSNYGHGNGILYIHSSLESFANSGFDPKVAALYSQVTIYPLPTGVTGTTLRQWEWGIPNVTIQAYQDVWTSLGKSISTITVLQGGVVQGFQATPNVWKNYLQKNQVTPRGMSIYSYWIASPALDRMDGTLPMPAYAFWKPDFTMVYDTAISFLNPIVSQFGNSTHLRFFMNNIGSTTDVPNSINNLMSQLHLRNYTAISIGTDTMPPSCTTLPPNAVTALCPHFVISYEMATLTAFSTISWIPLTVSELVTSVSPYYIVT